MENALVTRETRNAWWKWARRGLLLLAVLMAAGEAGVRLVGHEEDGNFILLGRRLRPYRLPAERLEASLEAYLAPESYMEYSATLGWKPKPGGRSSDGSYLYNAQCIRVADPTVLFDEVPVPGRTRIVLVGDSFTHGDDVPYEDTLGARLEAELEDRSFDAEIINLGVPGYGMGQALLRFREEGANLHPNLVVLGLQLENLARNQNLLRAFMMWRTGIPFTKPRFVLQDGGLVIVNQPTVSPEHLPALLRSPGAEWLEHETFYDPHDYADLFWRRSRFLAAAEVALRGIGSPRRLPAYPPDGDAGALGLAIVSDLARAAQEGEASFLAVHIPIRPTLAALQDGEDLAYAEFLVASADRFDTVDPLEALREVGRRDGLSSLFAPGSGHYSGQANAILARALAEHIAE